MKFKNQQKVKFYIESCGRYHFGTYTKDTMEQKGVKMRVVNCPALSHFEGDEGMWIEDSKIEEFLPGDEKLQAALEIEYATRHWLLSDGLYEELKRIALFLAEGTEITFMRDQRVNREK